MSPDFMNTVTIVSAGIALIGLIVTVAALRRSSRKKLLVYDISPSLALATVLPRGEQHQLSIIHEDEDGTTRNVQGAHLTFVRIGNLGREPIIRDNIAAKDPIKMTIANSKVLDFVLAAVSRDVNNFQVDRYEDESEGAEAIIDFDFLDHQDGALLRILTESPRPRISVVGTVIGMPDGVLRKEDVGSNPWLNRVGCFLAILLQLFPLGGALYIFKEVTGSFGTLWVFLLPIGGLVIPALIVSIVVSTVWPKGPSWPDRLGLPEWFRPLARRDDIRLSEARRRQHIVVDMDDFIDREVSVPPDWHESSD